jgi:drug/metabolite transporter (DMT)-like permease
MRFIAFTVGFSCLFILAHYALTRPASALLTLPAPVYVHGIALAVCGTVIPSFLLGIGLRRTGAQKFANIEAIDPVAAFALAWAILGDEPNLAQLGGFLLALCGGLWVTLRKAPCKPHRTKRTTDNAPHTGIAERRVP